VWNLVLQVERKPTGVFEEKVLRQMLETERL